MTQEHNTTNPDSNQPANTTVVLIKATCGSVHSSPSRCLLTVLRYHATYCTKTYPPADVQLSAHPPLLKSLHHAFSTPSGMWFGLILLFLSIPYELTCGLSIRITLLMTATHHLWSVLASECSVLATWEWVVTTMTRWVIWLLKGGSLCAFAAWHKDSCCSPWQSRFPDDNNNNDWQQWQWRQLTTVINHQQWQLMTTDNDQPPTTMRWWPMMTRRWWTTMRRWWTMMGQQQQDNDKAMMGQQQTMTGQWWLMTTDDDQPPMTTTDTTDDNNDLQMMMTDDDNCMHNRQLTTNDNWLTTDNDWQLTTDNDSWWWPTDNDD